MKKDTRKYRYRRLNTIYQTTNIFKGEDDYYHYLYKIYNKINQKIYIGIHSTKDINDNYSGSGYALNEAYKKYGSENFIKYIIQFFNNRTDLLNKESEIVNEEFIKDCNNYNLCLGGNAPLTNHVVVVDPHTNETFICSKDDYRYINGLVEHINSGTRNNRYGCHQNEEFKEHMRNIMKGKLSGKDSPFYGIKRSKDICDKIKQSKKGKICIHKDNKNKYINPTDLEYYINNGYIKGPCQKSIDNALKARQEKLCKNIKPNIGKHWYTNGIDNVLITDDKIQFYINNGYYHGRNNYRNKVSETIS